MRSPTSRLFAPLALLLLNGCGSDVPPNLPTTQAYQRGTPRIELVTLIVSDDERAARAKQLYVDMEHLMLAAKTAHGNQLTTLIGAHDKPLGDAEVKRIFHAMAKTERGAMERYIALQLELRRHLTAEEFARLDALK